MNTYTSAVFIIVLTMFVIFAVIAMNKTRESFTVLNTSQFEKEGSALGKGTCDALVSSKMSPFNKLVSDNYLNSQRIKKYKPEAPLNNASNKTTCFINDDIRNREYDPLIAAIGGCKDTDLFKKTPFISNPRVVGTPQATGTVASKMCVFDIDTNKTTPATLDKFWNEIAGNDECIQANAYNISLYNQLVIESKEKSDALDQVRKQIIKVSQANRVLASEVNSVNVQISSSNQILTSLTKKNTDLKKLNLQKINELGEIQSNFDTNYNKWTTYVESYIGKVNQQVKDTIPIQATNSNIYINLVSTSNGYNTLTTQYNILLSNLNEISIKFDDTAKNTSKAEKQLKDLTKANLDCTSNLKELTSQYDECSQENTKNITSNDIVVDNLKTCRGRYASCTRNHNICDIKKLEYDQSLSNYTKLLENCKSSVIHKKVDNARLTQDIKAGNQYFTWAQTEYMYLSCDSFNRNISDVTYNIGELQNQCKVAENKIQDQYNNIYDIASSITTNSMSNLQTCTINTINRRQAITDRMHPPLPTTDSNMYCESHSGPINARVPKNASSNVASSVAKCADINGIYKTYTSAMVLTGTGVIQMDVNTGIGTSDTKTDGKIKMVSKSFNVFVQKEEDVVFSKKLLYWTKTGNIWELQ